MNVVQPAGTQGEVKLLNPLTMENIADAVLAEGLASCVEIDQIVAEVILDVLSAIRKLLSDALCLADLCEVCGRKTSKG